MLKFFVGCIVIGTLYNLLVLDITKDPLDKVVNPKDKRKVMILEFVVCELVIVSGLIVLFLFGIGEL